MTAKRVLRIFEEPAGSLNLKHPHGRPTLIEMNYRKLEKKFGRQQ